MSFITVTNLTKKYNQFVAIEDINFSIEKGEIVALVGPNGSGKSTLAKIIVGIEKPTEGSIIFNRDNKKKEESIIGYVPQSFQLDRTLPMTVFEFLHLSLAKFESKKKEEQIILNALERVGVQSVMSKRLGALSGGQLQRVLIARVLLKPHDILVLDEPSASIDVGGEEELYAILQKLNKEDGTTLIIISHELDFVFRFATQVICINRSLMCRGVPQQVLTKKTIDSLYGPHVGHYRHNDDIPHHH